MTDSPLTDWPQLHGSHFAGQRVLVTGGAGFIGSHLAEVLCRLRADVVVLDDLSAGHLDNLLPARALGALDFVHSSLLNEAALARCTQGCRYVFHQAALGSVPRSVEQPRLYHEVNATGTLNVLEAARAAGVGRVMFAASSSAYGETPALPKTESIPPQPRSPYAATKVAAEALCLAYSCSYGLDTVPLRYFNIFGPRQSPDSAYAAVIAAFAKAIIAGRRPVIHGDGEQSRDFTYVDNAVQANLLAARHEGPIGGQALNVACGQRVSVNQLAHAMAEMLGRPDLTPHHEAERAGDVKHSLADLSRVSAVLGYKPIVGFERGLEATLVWYKSVLSSECGATCAHLHGSDRQ